MVIHLWRLARPDDDPAVVCYPQGMVRVAVAILEDNDELRDAIGFALAATPMVWLDGDVTADHLAQADAVVRLLRRRAGAEEG